MDVHDLACARRLRARRLAEAGDPAEPDLVLIHDLAKEITACCGHTRVKAYRLAYGWTVWSAVQRFHRMCQQQRLGARGLSERSWVQWEAGTTPSRDYQDLLCRLLRTGPVRLGFARDYTEPAMPEPPQRTSGIGAGDVGDIVASSADGALRHAARAQTTEVPPVRIDSLDVAVGRIARAYVHADPRPLVRELVAIRDEVYGLLDHRRYPRQADRLYVLAGQVCGLLGNAVLDAGVPHLASAHARAAWTYATVAEHGDLKAWVRGLQAMIAYWHGDAAGTVAFAHDGLSYTAGPPTTMRLWAIEALGHAVLGAERQALSAMAAAERANGDLACGDGTGIELREVGGEFDFSAAKRAYLAGGTHMHLGRAADAVASAGRAVVLYRDGPPDQRAYGNEALAYVDSAIGHAQLGEMDVAVAAIDRVLALPPQRRIDGVAQRLGRVRDRLRGPRFCGSRSAHSLIERIDQYQHDTMTRTLAPR